MKKLMVLCTFLLIGLNSFGINQKEEMKKLILEIRDKSPQNFIIIPQNGTNIYFKNNRTDKQLLDAIDGVTQESLKYGYPEYGEKTPDSERDSLLKNLTKLKKYGKTVMSVNYTDSNWGKWRSRELANDEGFLNYCSEDRSATKISKDIYFKNDNDINNLKDAKNFLYLLNPENFRHRAEYIDKLSQTEYDVIIIDLFFHELDLNVEELRRLKTKPQGGKRLIIGYFSIGEAEDYRKYWKKEWNEKLPNWILYENENWKGNYIVEYWSPEWKDIILDQLKQYEDAGFDGIFLDTIDTYESF